jgi:preprotein translocase subunit Sss1
MEEKKQPDNAVKNVFKNGRRPTREEYTNLWIKLINQIERENASQ